MRIAALKIEKQLTVWHTVRFAFEFLPCISQF
jgi:hypothetical protein